MSSDPGNKTHRIDLYISVKCVTYVWLSPRSNFTRDFFLNIFHFTFPETTEVVCKLDNELFSYPFHSNTNQQTSPGTVEHPCFVLYSGDTDYKSRLGDWISWWIFRDFIHSL